MGLGVVLFGGAKDPGDGRCGLLKCCGGEEEPELKVEKVVLCKRFMCALLRPSI